MRLFFPSVSLRLVLFFYYFFMFLKSFDGIVMFLVFQCWVVMFFVVIAVFVVGLFCFCFLFLFCFGIVFFFWRGGGGGVFLFLFFAKEVGSVLYVSRFSDIKSGVLKNVICSKRLVFNPASIRISLFFFTSLL